jgi:hypothetical protein
MVDSGVVEIDRSITALIGKNESGKSAFIDAMYRLNPAYPERFDKLQDAPRWRLRRDEQQDSFEEIPPITATFELDDADRQRLMDALGFDPKISDSLTISRYYSNELKYRFELDEKTLVSSMMSSAGANKNHLRGERPETVERLLTLLEEVVGVPIDDDPEEEFDENTPIGKLRLFATAISKTNAPKQTIFQILKKGMPTFFRFNEWSQLPGRISLDDLANTSVDDLSPEMRTALSLVTMSGATVKEFLDEDYETRKAELEASANEITQQVFEYWTQNTTLSVHFDDEEETVSTPQGQTSVVKWLQVRILDRRHQMTTNFDLRSTGFQWFFSFLAAFHQYETKKDIVVLLDEPGLGLHGRAQKDFMRFINERLASNHHVLYTTHSPFMVEPGHLERARLVEDDPDLEIGATITGDIRVRDPDTLFPLQGALGYDIAQSLFVAGENLVVEGISDFIYLTTISDHLTSIGRTGLAEHWNVVPVGGVAKIPTFVALLGTHLNVTVLVDSTSSVSDRLDNLKDEGILEGSRILRIGQIFSSRGGNIEDIFTEGEYITLFDEAFSTSTKVADLAPGSDSIVKRLERMTGSQFSHAEPAIAMLTIRDGFLGALSDNTIDRFEQLFIKVNATV